MSARRRFWNSVLGSVVAVVLVGTLAQPVQAEEPVEDPAGEVAPLLPDESEPVEPEEFEEPTRYDPS